jgi:hypothetical protein
MTYQDPNIPRRPVPPDDVSRRIDGDDTSYTGWILGGFAALALILGVFFMFGRDDGTTSTADNNKPAATSTSPATTGQRTEPVQPTNPAGNMPTTTGSGSRTDSR